MQKRDKLGVASWRQILFKPFQDKEAIQEYYQERKAFFTGIYFLKVVDRAYFFLEAIISDPSDQLTEETSEPASLHRAVVVSQYLVSAWMWLLAIFLLLRGPHWARCLNPVLLTLALALESPIFIVHENYFASISLFTSLAWLFLLPGLVCETVAGQ